VVILLNALLILVELEYNGRKSRATIGLEAPGSNYSPELETMFYVFNVIFAAAFAIELIFRLAAFGCPWLKRPMNWLDIVIVGGSILDVVGAGAFMNLTFLRLVRLSKLTRLLKVALMAAFCEPLRILIKSISTSFGYLFWSLGFLTIVQIISALFMTQLLASALNDESLDLDLRLFIYTYYGTTSRSILTMFQVTMAPGSWSVVGRRIIEEVNPAFAWFYIAYVGGVSFAVVRIITALFLRKTLSIAVMDESDCRNEKVKKQRRVSEEIRDSWEESCEGPDGRLGLPQFQRFILHKEAQKWLEILEVDRQDACSMFELLSDTSGLITLDEFLCGFFRLTHTSKQIDMVVLQHESSRIAKLIDQLHAETQHAHNESNMMSTLISSLHSEVQELKGILKSSLHSEVVESVQQFHSEVQELKRVTSQAEVQKSPQMG